MALEVCVDNVKSALNAYNGGARRLELCTALCLGGLTPSVGLLKVLKKLIPSDCLIFVMIRPKPGEDYNYDENEINAMMQDISTLKENGADGFVFGCLDKNKVVDKEACIKLLKTAGNYPCTFHRAFDVVKYPEESLKTIIHLGFSRILTSGQQKTAFSGRNLIKRLVLTVEQLGSNLIIMPGGGVNPNNLEEILKTTGVKEYHGSARLVVDSDNVNEQLIWTTDKTIVEEMVAIAKRYSETA